MRSETQAEMRRLVAHLVNIQDRQTHMPSIVLYDRVSVETEPLCGGGRFA